ncbi:MAG TPA: GGDEF domain-containing protein [Xanthobacteraceae bacterium]|nr:GGDEF domain-containing protein [Xanthobacteraceae bacterium]
MKHKTASSRDQSTDPARSATPRKAAEAEAKDAEPKAPKPRSGSAAARLAAEVERLSAELAASRLRIGELENRVDVDPLTQTFNRRGFERALARSLAYVKRYHATAALVYLDLDEFKPVNDRHGHAAGDAVLKAISGALLREVRASDIVARIGGDEFVVLLWNMTEADAHSKAAALEKAVYATPVRWGASTMVVGASAGVAVIGPLDTPGDVLTRADAAMYARKMERRDGHAPPSAAQQVRP